MNTASERLKAWNLFICQYFSFCEQLKVHAQLSWAWKNITSGPNLSSFDWFCSLLSEEEKAGWLTLS